MGIYINSFCKFCNQNQNRLILDLHLVLFNELYYFDEFALFLTRLISFQVL